ncbi:MAG TPA: glycosyl hydrolase family 28-related protein [Abditibacterium sp.]|jgi:polygalacturonase
MKSPFLSLWVFGLSMILATASHAQLPTSNAFNVRTFGAKGDGKTIDSPSIDRAINAASAAGGGTVYFPAGSYASYTVHLKSDISLYLDSGATLLAAETVNGVGYDAPEPNTFDKYQDFGHSHFQNSLLFGENLHDVSILGPGRIWGRGLVNFGHQSRTRAQNDALRATVLDPAKAPFNYPDPRDAVESGWGNKSISLKNCRNVTMRDFSILHGGHFGILATGVDNLVIVQTAAQSF